MGAGSKRVIQYFSIANGRIAESVRLPNGEWGDEINHDFYVGFLRWVEIFDDTYQNKPVQKVRLVFLDSDNKDQIAYLKFTLKSWASISFFGRIMRVELDSEFTLTALKSKNADKVTFLRISQSGQNIEGEKDFPEPTAIDRDTKDWRITIARIESNVHELQQKLVSIHGGPYHSSEKHAEDNHPGVAIPVSSPKPASRFPDHAF